MKKILQSVFIIAIGFSFLNATELYNQCAGCHGLKGETVALGRSKVINKMDAQEIIDALNGYKNNSYGGAMKGLMKVQVKKLTLEEIKEIAQFISKK